MVAQGGGEGVVLFASKADDGRLHLILANHEGPATNVTVKLTGAKVSTDGATVARIDDSHANAFTAWVGMGSPKADANGVLDAEVVGALHSAAALVEEPLALAPLAAEEGDGAAVMFVLPHHGVARARITLT